MSLSDLDRGRVRCLARALLGAQDATASLEDLLCVGREAVGLVQMHRFVVLLLDAADRGATIDLGRGSGPVVRFMPHDAFIGEKSAALDRIIEELDSGEGEDERATLSALERDLASSLDPNLLRWLEGGDR
ncbi:MAG: hypothetical protein QOE83_2250 [Actinomycetota bacterium]|nr:hypothetical protein [Actinomycetota bacterium]